MKLPANRATAAEIAKQIADVSKNVFKMCIATSHRLESFYRLQLAKIPNCFPKPIAKFKNLLRVRGANSAVGVCPNSLRASSLPISFSLWRQTTVRPPVSL